jgi:hypothetical protein
MKHNDSGRDDERFDDEGTTRPTGRNYITQDGSDDGLDRRGFLRCMAWAGTATVWALRGGVPTSENHKGASQTTRRKQRGRKDRVAKIANGAWQTARS